MIAELGLFALILALFAALAGAVWPWRGAALESRPMMAVAGPAAGMVFALVSLSFGALIAGYALSDFSIVNVAANSHSLKPLFYKVSAAWGNHEGSMLLWLWVLSLAGFLASRACGDMPGSFRARALASQMALAVLFLLYILFASNPFWRLDPAPMEGAGLNPVLQDPALAFHPPLLYLGYVGYSIVFSFAVAALKEGRAGTDFARFIAPWVLGAFAFLTLGIALGSLWAYYELGWGGFWFWDPVENASLMPWACGLMLIHARAALEKRGVFPGWVLLLCVLAFGFSLTGTFLVRSGILTSVHAFAVDPERGVFMLAILALCLGGAFWLYAARIPTVLRAAGDKTPQLASREGVLFLGNVVVLSILTAIAAGTFYPVFLAVLGAPEITVGPPYYETVIFPLAALAAVLMMLGPFMSWQKAILARALAPVGALVLAGLLLAIAFGGTGGLAAVLGFGFGLAALASPLYAFRRAGTPRALLGMTLAHAGAGVLALGITAATVFKDETIAYLAPGQTLKLGGRILTFDSLGDEVGPNYNTRTATLTLDGGAVLRPERRWWPAARTWTTESALDFSATGVTYAVLGEEHPKERGQHVIRAWYHPFVYAIWGGGCLMALGAALSCRRRKKEGAS